MMISEAIEHKSGIRALAAGGVPFEKINRACARSVAAEHWCSGYEAGLYCDDVAAFVDLNLKKIAEGNAKPLSNDRYDFFIAMALGLVEKDPKKYARYIPAIENFAKLVFGDPRGAAEAVLGQRSNLDQLRTACFLFVKGAGLLSPDLQEIERRVMMKKSNLEVMWHDGIAGPMMTKEQVMEKAARVKQTSPPETLKAVAAQRKAEENLASLKEKLQIFLDCNDIYEDDRFKLVPGGLSAGAYFNKLFTEDRPLFDKIHRAFYWKQDGKAQALDGLKFEDSFNLLAIKLAHGEGQ
jgi:hypothetical protein